VSGAKRAAPAGKEDGFQQRSLARSVRPDDDVEMGGKVEIRGSQAAQALDMEACQAHTRRYSRIGITTYRALVVPGDRIRQLLLASDKPISTVSVSTADKASSR
jgi:hypothetical protein